MSNILLPTWQIKGGAIKDIVIWSIFLNKRKIVTVRSFFRIWQVQTFTQVMKWSENRLSDFPWEIKICNFISIEFNDFWAKEITWWRFLSPYVSWFGKLNYYFTFTNFVWACGFKKDSDQLQRALWRCKFNKRFKESR